MKQKVSLEMLGASREVGRSSFVLDCGDHILLDRGVKLSPKQTEYPLPVKTVLDAAIISHAHMDHSGHLPELFKGHHCPTFLTQPTLDLSKLLWFDTLKIAGLEGIDSHFSKQDIERVERYSFPLHYKRRVDITKNTSLEFFDAGHILGSCLSKLSLSNGKTFLYTGDFNYTDTRLHNKADLKFGKVDYLVTESTYGNRNHLPRKESEKLFVESVQDTIEKGGHAIVSSFAVGRSQELVDVLFEYNLNADVYLDGMGQKAATIMMNYPHLLKNSKRLKRALHKAHWVKKPQIRSKALKKPSVIVTTSGMLAGGPVYHYLKKLHKDEKSKLYLTGFQVKDTPGRILLDTGKINIDGALYEVKMPVEKFDFSSHAGHDGLVKAVEKMSPQKIVCVHGDSDIIDQFSQELTTKGFEVLTPRVGEKIDL